jgi:ATP-dependent Clp protease adapter protein ClpS
MLWEALFATVFAGVGASALARWVGIWPRYDLRARLVIQTAAALAGMRRHEVIEGAHLALALTADEEISRELEARGVDVATLYEDVEALLAPANDATPATVRWSDDAMRVLALVAKERFFPATARHLFFTLLRSDTAASAVLARHWSGDARGREAEGGGPYRGRPSRKDEWCVRIWNDDRTTMEFVVATLRDTVMLNEARAIHAMLVTHHAGSAIVHRCERDEAVRLAKIIGDAAVTKRFPLRVTAEEVDH